MPAGLGPPCAKLPRRVPGRKTMPRQRNPRPEFPLQVRRGRFEFLVIYEVSEGELDLLVQGAPNSIYLNFAIALLSTALSFIIALATTTIDSLKTFTVFVVLAVIGIV